MRTLLGLPKIEPPVRPAVDDLRLFAPVDMSAKPLTFPGSGVFSDHGVYELFGSGGQSGVREAPSGSSWRDQEFHRLCR